MAANVLAILYNGIEDGTITQEHQNSSSLEKIGNYLLYGNKIDDSKLSGVAKNLWNKYEAAKQEQEFLIKQQQLEKSIKAYKQGAVDNTGRKNAAGFDP